MLRKKWISLLVAISMVAAMVPSTAFADEAEPESTATSVITTEASEETDVQETETPSEPAETVEDDTTQAEDETTDEAPVDETVTEDAASEEAVSEDTQAPADVTEDKTEEAEEPASEAADTDEDTAVAPPATTPEVTETPAPDSGIATMAETTDGETENQVVATVDGKEYENFAEAFNSLQEGSTLVLNQDVELQNTLKIDTNKVTIDLGGNKLYGDFGGNLIDLTNDATGVSGVKIMNGTLAGGTKHTLNIWNAQDVTLENLTLDNSKTEGGAPLIVGSSDVTLQGTITTITGENSWYAINVDCRMVGENAVPASLTAAAKVLFQGAAKDKPGICVENTAGKVPSDATVNLVDGFEGTDEGAECSDVVSIHPNNKVGATIDYWIGYDVVEGAVARIGWDYYTNLAAACAAAESGETVVLCISQQPVELDSKLVLNKDDVTLDLNGNTVTASENFVDNSGSTPSDHPHLIEVMGNNVTIKNGTLVATEKNEHTVHVYRANGVRLEGLTIDNSNSKDGYYGYPLVVNGSQVTLAGDVKFVPKNDFGVNIDGNGQTAALTFAEDAKVDFGGKSGIKADNDESTDSITFENGVEIANYQEFVTGTEEGGSLTIEGIENSNIDTSKLGYAASVGDTYYNTFAEAYWNIGENDTVTLYDDVTLDSMLTINKSGVIFDLNGHTISPSGAFAKESDSNQNHLIDITADNVTFGNGTLEIGANNNHTLNVWGAKGVKIYDVTLDNAQTYGGAPLVVGASDVTLEGDVKLITGENSWYGMNVDSRKVGNTDTGASLTLDSANVAVTGPKAGGIFVENTAGSEVTLNFNGASAVTGAAEGFVPVQFAVNEEGEQSANATLNFANDFDASKLGIGATVTTADGTTKGYNTFADAIAAAQKGDTVKLFKNVELDSVLAISTDNLTLDLNGNTISGSANFVGEGANANLVNVLADNVTIMNGTLQAGAKNKHALNLYGAENVTLKDLTIDGSMAGMDGAPLVLGGSTATLEGTTTIKTNKDHSWYGVNVDSKNGVASELTVNGKIVFEGENQNNAGIWVEDQDKAGNVKVTFNEGSSVQGNGMEGFEVVHIVKIDDAQQGTVTGGENAGLVTDEDGNFIVKPAPSEDNGSSSSSSSSSSSHEHSYVWQGSPDEHWQYCTDCGQVVSNGAHTFQWKDGVQVCSVCGYKVTETSTAAPADNTNAAAAAPAAGTTATAASTGIPQTSDESNPLLWVALLAVSGSALGGLVIYKKKKEN